MLKGWKVKDAGSPAWRIRVASDAGIGGRGGGWEGLKREPGKMGGVGSWHLPSCSPTHLLVLEWVGFWNSAEHWDFFPVAFWAPCVNWGFPHTAPQTLSQLCSWQCAFLPGIGEGVGRKKDLRKGEGFQQRTWSVLNEALSELTSKTVFTPARITLATSRAKGVLVFRSVLWWGSLEIQR